MSESEKATAPQIEITPEMVEAGVEAYCDRDFRFGDREDLVSAIYVAMVRAKVEAGARDVMAASDRELVRRLAERMEEAWGTVSPEFLAEELVLEVRARPAGDRSV